MATRRFCDLCDRALQPEDDQPLVRELEYTPISSTGERVWPEGEPKPKAVAYVEVTNQNNKPLTDVCLGCRLRIVTDGTATVKPSPSPIATLQPEVAADRPPVLKPFAAPTLVPSKLLPETPPKAEPVAPPPPFEPSMPT